MNRRKPNILMTIALVLMVLAVVVCLVVFLTSRGNKETPAETEPVTEAQPTEEPTEPSEPEETDFPVDTTPEAPQSSFDKDALQAELDDSLDGVTSTWQVVVVDVATGETVVSNANCTEEELMVAADLPELFIMATVYQQIEAGTLVEDDVKTLLHEMIREDKDSASNELTKLLGGGDGAQGREAVNAFAKAIGCEHFEFNRLFGEEGTQNFVTAADCATLLMRIAKGECVSADASAKMQELLTGTPGERIPGGAPAGASVAHLNANITGSCCADAGIVTTDNGEFVIVIICNKPVTNEGSTKKCVELTELVSAHYAS